jgi:hypothetical protein
MLRRGWGWRSGSTLTGKVLIEDDGSILLDERRLMGRQGRLVFAHLACEHLRAVSSDELAEELWLGNTPPAWERSLSAIISKLSLPADMVEGWIGMEIAVGDAVHLRSLVESLWAQGAGTGMCRDRLYCPRATHLFHIGLRSLRRARGDLQGRDDGRCARGLHHRRNPQHPRVRRGQGG